MAYLFAMLVSLVRLLTEARRAKPVTEAAEPPVSTETDEAWRAVLDDARKVLTAENYPMWFAKTWVIAREGDLRRGAAFGSGVPGIASPDAYHSRSGS